MENRKTLKGYALKDKRGIIWFSTMSEYESNTLAKKEMMEFNYENHAPFILIKIEVSEVENGKENIQRKND